MSSTPKQLLSYLATQRDAQTEFLRALVRTPSDNPPGDCQALAEVAQDALQALGLTVETDAVPPDAVQANGMRAVTNLIVRHRFGTGGPVIALNAHGDVVPPGDGWGYDPYGAQIVEHPEHGPTLYGRGAAVSKSDFATYTWALLALKEAEQAGAALAGTVELHLTFDEEAGGEIGPARLLANGLSRPDYAISAGFAYGVVAAHNGCLHLEVTVRGRQAHAALPHTGVDALEAATHLLSALYASRTALARQHSATDGIDSPTLNIGLIEGGINTNVVPDRVSFRVDRRVIPEESMATVEAELRALLAEAAAARLGITIEIRTLLRADPLPRLPRADRLIEALTRHAQAQTGHTIPVTGSPLYTDARHYAAAGIPTVLYGAGPRTLAEAGGHNVDENIRLGDLALATDVVTLTLAEMLGAS
ncbi:M20/M25/M40 family metallo-hydrolase [Achromobacter sp. GG226]|uniref:M20/M25/M40 family metallo-hydrolase n=1 Tax=Verticiella alkaliphila TaxID=2779529 RepID=UPI001C0ADA83|nr:M20/M25/M40 family metallo-hydrolase [Verticiella sp. GG226]MBU4609539.1 M20/M25/M40 family metallo-hydrolase [Verticiella sp. GG226]